MTEWNIRSQCRLPGHPLKLFYGIAMSVHCYMSVPVSLSEVENASETPRRLTLNANWAKNHRGVDSERVNSEAYPERGPG